jgi:hypothetical protein
MLALALCAIGCGDDDGGDGTDGGEEDSGTDPGSGAGRGGSAGHGGGGDGAGRDGGMRDGGADAGGADCDLSDGAGDCDGDGRTNEEEVEGYDIKIDSSGFGLEDLSLLEDRHVDSDPELADSDGDGLDDSEEYLGRSDPSDPDTDGDGLDDGDEVTRWQTSAISVDTDGDARAGDMAPDPDLFDAAELALEEDPETGELVPGTSATSPSLADTDGDGVDDTDEVGSPVRSAAIADLPAISVELVDDVDLRLNVVYTDDTAHTAEYGSTISHDTSNELARSDSSSTTLSAELSATVGVEVEASLPPSATVSASVTATAGIEHSTSTEVTSTTTQAFGEELSQAKSESIGRSVSTESGSLAVGVDVRNTGEIAYRVANLGIAVRQFVVEEGRTRSLTLLSLESALSGGVVLGPNEHTGTIPLESDDLPADLVRSFMRTPSSLIFEPVGVDLQNADGTSFTFLTEATFERTALVVIDAGDGHPLALRPATNVNRDDSGELAGVTLGGALDAAGVDYELAENTAGRRVLSRIDSFEAETHSADGPSLGDPAYPSGREPGTRRAKRFWALFGGRDGGELDLDRDADRIVVQNRDELYIAYVRDDDQDGVSDREEFLRGSSDASPHSDGDVGDPDGDGLSDWFEIKVGWTVTTAESAPYHVFPSPAVTDSDGDGLDDREEYDAGTDPRLPDTDGDGVDDASDLQPLGFQNMAPTFATVDVSLTGETARVTADVDDTDLNVTTVTIAWGDGSADTVLTTGFDAIDVQHQYTASGEFVVTVTAADEELLTAEYTENVMPWVFPNDAILRLALDGNTANTGTQTITVSPYAVTAYTTDRHGTGNRAANLFNNGDSGSGGMITTPNLSLGREFTFSVWVLSNGTNNNNVNFMGQNNWFTIYSSGNRMRFGIVNGTTPDEGADDPAESSNMPTGVWRHYVGVVARAGASLSQTEARFYVNGALIGTETFSLLDSPNTCGLHIGSPADSGNYCSSTSSSDTSNNFNGQVDDVRVYRRALSAEEVALLYAE